MGLIKCCDCGKEISDRANKFASFYWFFESLRQTAQEKQPADVLDKIVDFADIKPCRVLDDLRVVFSQKVPITMQFIRKILDESSMSGSQIDTLIKRLNKIPILSVHQTKGCEFDVVFIVNADDMNFPTRFGTIEEEMRIFYVAISRAKKKMFLSGYLLHPRFNKIYKQVPSRFISLIPSEYIDFTDRSW